MNAAAKALEQALISPSNLLELVCTRQVLTLVLLMGLVLSSAFGLIFMKDYHRRLVGELQMQRTEARALHVERGKLLLEESTWAAPQRIQQIAQNRLQMQIPAADAVIIVSDGH